MPGIFGRPSALPFFAKQKAIIIVPPFYRKTAPLRKGSFGGTSFGALSSYASLHRLAPRARLLEGERRKKPL